MNLPKAVADLVNAQNHFDGTAYANCFTDTAVVYDEGKTHRGKTEIKNWIEKANRAYKARMKPLAYSEDTQTLHAEISGTFAGSPIVLAYRFEMEGEYIRSLRIV